MKVIKEIKIEITKEEVRLLNDTMGFFCALGDKIGDGILNDTIDAKRCDIIASTCAEILANCWYYG